MDGGVTARCRRDFGNLGSEARVLSFDDQRAVGLTQTNGILIQARMLSRIDVQHLWMPCATSRVRIRCMAW